MSVLSEGRDRFRSAERWVKVFAIDPLVSLVLRRVGGLGLGKIMIKTVNRNSQVEVLDAIGQLRNPVWGELNKPFTGYGSLHAFKNKQLYFNQTIVFYVQ